MTQNATGAATKSGFRGNRLAALDKLPKALRRAHHQAVLPWDPLETLAEYRALKWRGYTAAQAQARIIADIERADAAEQRQFAATVWPKWAGAYPASAAMATPMIYEERALRRASRIRRWK